jgi:hypothetical protein
MKSENTEPTQGTVPLAAPPSALPVMSKVRLLDLFSIEGRPVWWSVIRGVIIDVRHTSEGVRYIIDPSLSGHYGHKRHNIKPEDVDPTQERIEAAEKIAPVKWPRGFAALPEKPNGQAPTMAEDSQKH